MQIAKNAGVPMLIGSSQHQKFRSAEPRPKLKFQNSAFLIDPEKGLSRAQSYHKNRLFPFGEYLPYRDVIPWSAIGIPDLIGYIPGEGLSVFETPEYRFCVTICWENMFPDLVRQFVNRGAQFIINITNEAWFGKTAAPYQFVSMNVFRAVENGVYVVRCANTGVSCFIDPCGRITNRVENKNGQDIFIPGVKCSAVIPLESKTLYARYGDWLVWVCTAVSVFFLAFSFFGKTISKPSTSERRI
jgi:apolipoprotein N-acyltransferase